VEGDWLVCPSCRTRLHRVCPTCNRLTEPEWSLCAYCGHEFERPPVRAAAAAPVSSSGSRTPELAPDAGALRGATNR
jgi:predicted amidophosphoribosyltransferase